MTINHIERQREHFNSIAARYCEARSGENHLVLKRLMWQLFFSRNDIRSSGPLRVLEPMCGFADGFDILSRHVQDNIYYEGYDYSDRVVEIVRKQRPNVKVWQADATTYYPEHGAYDVIVLLGALHHVHRRAGEVISAIVPALKPGGWLISLEPTNGNIITYAVRSLIYKRNDFFDEETERAFSTGELDRLFARSGLVHVDSIYPGLLSYILYYNPDAFPRLNLGGPRMVTAAFGLDKLAIGNALGRMLSFATLSLWRTSAAERGHH